MNKEEKTNTMLDNAVQGLNHARDIYSRLGEITRLMPLIKDKSELVRNDPSSHDSVTYCDGFLDGYNSRIETVWHDITEIPENNRSLLCVTDHGCNVFGPNNTEFKEVVEYFHIKKWAYLEDLVPNTEDCV